MKSTVVRALGIALAAAWLGGCIPVVKSAPTASVTRASDAYFVMGVTPTDDVVWIVPGEVKDGVFDAGAATLLPPSMTSSAVGRPDNGYVVHKVPAGTTLGLYGVQFPNKIGLITPIYYACSTIVFTVPGGKVVYVGDVTFDARASRFYVSGNGNIDSARDFLSQHYPLLASALERGTSQAATTDRCRR